MSSFNFDTLFDKDSEKQLLGSMMVDPEVVPRILLIVKPESFYTANHQLIFKTIVSIYDETQQTDPFLVANRLKLNNELNRAGGTDYLYELQSPIVETESSEYFAKIVQDYYMRRLILQNASKIREMCVDGSLSVQQIIDNSQNIVSSFVIGESASVKVQEMLNPTVKMIEANGKRDGRLVGISTEFSALDDITLGLQGGHLYVIASRPSRGKTTFATNIARNISTGAEYPVLLFSLEMPVMDLMFRLLSGLSGINLTKVKTGKISEEQYYRLVKAVERLKESNLLLNDNTTLSIDSMLAETRRIYNENRGLSLMVVDYLQLIKAHRSSPNATREQEVAYMSRELKRLSIELDIPILACAQLNRAVESRASKEPQLSDLRESGAIEQDADLVAFIHHEQENTEDDEKEVYLLIKKNRNGRCGEIIYNFRSDILLFEERS